MTSNIRTHQIAEVIPHATWITSPDYLAAQRLAEQWELGDEVIDALGLNGREPRAVSAVTRERQRRPAGSARRKDRG